MKAYFYLFFGFFLYLGFGVFFTQLNLKITNPKSIQQTQFFDYSGALNVHSNKSTGGASVQQIVAAASEAGLDFLIFHEEDVISKKQPKAIKYGSVRVFYGFEYNYNGSDLLYTEIENDKILSSYTEAQLFVENIVENGDEEALLILAHPNKKGYEWGSDQFKKIDGLEVLNVREVWRRAWKRRKLAFLTSLPFYPFNPDLFFLSIFSSNDLAIKEWEVWAKLKPTALFAGSDVTSKLRLYKNKFVNFPGYKTIFSLVKNHILLETELTGYRDHEKILKALKRGQSYFSLEVLGSPKGFAFYALDKSKSKHLMGSHLSLKTLEHFKVILPQANTDLKIRLFKGGEEIYSSKGELSYSPKTAGVYWVTVEVSPFFPLIRSQTWIPWIVSNPIYIN